MSLIEFLLARISEDEELALAPFNHWTNCGTKRGEKCTCTATLGKRNRRRIAECKGKRRIVDWCRHVEVDPAHRVAHGVLQLLALPSADRSDYDESWRL
jgi:hypothetical protein